MATQPLTQNIEQQPKKQSKTKILLLVFLVFNCISLTAGFLGGLTVGSLAGNGNATPTPTATVSATPVTSKTPTLTPSVSVTHEDNPYSEWIQYVLSDCQLRLYAPSEFLPGRRGEQGSCGSFATVSSSFTNFDDFPGVFIIFTPYIPDKDEMFGHNSKTIAQYLTSLTTDATKQTELKDVLISEEELVLSNQKTKVYKIDSLKLGTASYIFYSVAGKEYQIAWGGQNTSQFAKTIDLLIKSIEFTSPVK